MFSRFPPEGPTASQGPVSAGAWFWPPFSSWASLPLKCARLAAGASVLGQLLGWPNSFTLAALRGEFFRESLHLPDFEVLLITLYDSVSTHENHTGTVLTRGNY